MTRLGLLSSLLVLAGCSAPAPTPTSAASPGAQARSALRAPPDTIGDLFLGQVDATTSTVNRVEGREFNNPDGAALDTSVTPPRLYVVDSANHRVLAWRDATFATNAPADLVLGQPDLLTTASGCALVGPATLCNPRGIAVDPAGNVYVSDTGNHRVLEFDRPFEVGAVADRVYGQNGSFYSSAANLGGAPTASSMSAPTGVAIAPSGALLVADTGNHRVLRIASPASSPIAAAVFGQPDFASSSPNHPDALGFMGPSRAIVDRTSSPAHVYVADTDNNRVLGWRDLTTFLAGGAADLVLGQADFSGVLCNRNGTAATAATLCRPRGLALDDAHRLYVADTENNRVLRFDDPAAPGATLAASAVFGQASVGTRACGSATSGFTALCAPRGVAVSPAGDLFVADTNNHRVLWFQGGSDPIADAVFGQPTLTRTGCNSGGVISNATLCSPRGVWVDAAGNLYVADSSNHRVLEYDAPLSDALADRVFGQLTFATGTCNLGGALGAGTLCSPGSVATDAANNVWIGDEGNSRALGYASPLTTDVLADLVAGQPSATSSPCTSVSNSCTPSSAVGVAVDAGNNLYVVDPTNHRVVRFDTPFAAGGNTTGDKYVGQVDSVSKAPNWTDAAGLNGPTDVAIDRASSPAKLFVVDNGNNRVLVFDDVEAPTGAVASGVIGQATVNANRCVGTPSKAAICNPGYATTDAAGRLYVSDGSWDRVTRYDPPIATGASTLGVALYGQSSWSSSTANYNGITDTSLNFPRGMAVLPDQSALIVVDRGNHRVVRYPDPLAATTAPVAAAVLGQPGFSSAGLNAVDEAGLSNPYAVAIDHSVVPNRAYIVDRGNNRVLGYASVDALMRGASADRVFGQPDFWRTSGNSTSVSASTLNSPTGAAVDGEGNLWVADNGNNRVLFFPRPYDGAMPYAATLVIGQADLTKSTCNRGGGPTQATLCNPYAVAVDEAGNVYVADAGNSRVLAFLQPRTTDTDADLVFGQSDVFSNGANSGGVSARSLSNPNGLAIDTTAFPPRLWIADTSNSRVLWYNDPLGDDPAADGVVGQSSFTVTGGANGVGRFSGPQGIAVDPAGTLYVADSGNSRVLQLLAPTTTDLNADLLFGQQTSASAGCNAEGAVSATTLCSPRGLAVDDRGSVFVADSGNQRVVVYLANRFPEARDAALHPGAPTSADAVSVSFTYADADGDPESPPSVIWRRDGTAVPELGGKTLVPQGVFHRGESWSCELAANDGLDLGTPVILGPFVVGNGAPLIDAGADVTARLDALVPLAGKVVDPDGDSVAEAHWEQVSGTPGTLEGTAESATFRAKDPGTHRLRLVATDANGATASDEVVLTFITHGDENRPPLADPGPDQEVLVGSKVTLDATASHDPDPLDRLSFRWEPVGFPTGNPPSLEGAATAKPTFVAEVAGPYAFRLWANDGDLTSAPRVVTVIVRPERGVRLGCGASVAPGDGLLALGLVLLWLVRRRWGQATFPPMPRCLATKSPFLVAVLLLLPIAAEAQRARRDLPMPPPPSRSAKPPAPAPRADAGPPNPYLDEARELYANFQFDGVLSKLEFALAVKGVTPAQKVEIHKLAAFTHAAFDDAEHAEASFLAVLEIDPTFQLGQGASPKIRGYFERAQRALRAKQLVKLQHQPPLGQLGEATTVDVVATSGAERISQMTLHYRLAESKTAYSQLPMARGDEGGFSATVPSLFPGPARRKKLEYFIRARDEKGALLAQVGDEGAPLALFIETKLQAAETPLYQSWVFWTAVGVTAAGAATLPFLLKRDVTLQPGSLGLERLP